MFVNIISWSNKPILQPPTPLAMLACVGPTPSCSPSSCRPRSIFRNTSPDTSSLTLSLDRLTNATFFTFGGPSYLYPWTNSSLSPHQLASCMQPLSPTSLPCFPSIFERLKTSYLSPNSLVNSKIYALDTIEVHWPKKSRVIEIYDSRVPLTIVVPRGWNIVRYRI